MMSLAVMGCVQAAFTTDSVFNDDQASKSQARGQNYEERSQQYKAALKSAVLDRHTLS